MNEICLITPSKKEKGRSGKGKDALFLFYYENISAC